MGESAKRPSASVRPAVVPFSRVRYQMGAALLASRSLCEGHRPSYRVAMLWGDDGELHGSVRHGRSVKQGAAHHDRRAAQADRLLCFAVGAVLDVARRHEISIRRRDKEVDSRARGAREDTLGAVLDLRSTTFGVARPR